MKFRWIEWNGDKCQVGRSKHSMKRMRYIISLNFKHCSCLKLLRKHWKKRRFVEPNSVACQKPFSCKIRFMIWYFKKPCLHISKHPHICMGNMAMHPVKWIERWKIGLDKLWALAWTHVLELYHLSLKYGFGRSSDNYIEYKLTLCVPNMPLFNHSKNLDVYENWYDEK